MPDNVIHGVNNSNNTLENKDANCNRKGLMESFDLLMSWERRKIGLISEFQVGDDNLTNIIITTMDNRYGGKFLSVKDCSFQGAETSYVMKLEIKVD